MADFFAALVERIVASGVAEASELRGCSEEEIAALERQLGVRLPAAYRRYLEVMGHGSGALFTHDHLDASYEDVIGWNESQRQPCESEPGWQVPLPPDGLIVSARLGEQVEFIRCEGGEDAVVWHVAEWDDEIAQSHVSICAWLTCWCDAAEEAVRSGYFQFRGSGSRAVSMSHEAYIFDHARFTEELAPVLFEALSTGTKEGLKVFVAHNRAALTFPWEAKPVPLDLDAHLARLDIHELGDVALTKYYDDDDNRGLGERYSALPAEASAYLLGTPFGPKRNRFDPRRQGSYFQDGPAVLRSIAALRAHEIPDLGPFADALEEAAAAGRGLYVTL